MAFCSVCGILRSPALSAALASPRPSVSVSRCWLYLGVNSSSRWLRLFFFLYDLGLTLLPLSCGSKPRPAILSPHSWLPPTPFLLLAFMPCRYQHQCTSNIYPSCSQEGFLHIIPPAVFESMTLQKERQWAPSSCFLASEDEDTMFVAASSFLKNIII